MTQEDKDLLLRDLCARLPYRVKCNIPCEPYIATIQTIDTVYLDGCVVVDYSNSIDSHFLLKDIKPYLRPMSSMTEEEQVELGKLIGTASYNMLKGDMSHLDALLVHIYKNHIDAFGLIPQGLALEAPKEMYKTE